MHYTLMAWGEFSLYAKTKIYLKLLKRKRIVGGAYCGALG